MKIPSPSLGLAMLLFASFGVTAPVFGPGSIMLIPHAVVPTPTIPVTRYTIHCDAGKTMIVQEFGRTETGEESRTIAINTMAGNTYMLGTVGSTVMMRRKTQGGEFVDMHIDLWESHMSAESPNYFLKAGGKPNDCAIVKKE